MKKFLGNNKEIILGNNKMEIKMINVQGLTGKLLKILLLCLTETQQRLDNIFFKCVMLLRNKRQ